MTTLKTLTLTHANNKQSVEVANELIFAYYVSPAHKSTYLVSSGGAILPVLESPEVIRTMREQLGDKQNGTN